MPNPTITIDEDFASYVKTRVPYGTLLPDTGCCHDSIGYDAHPYPVENNVTVHVGCDRCRARATVRVEGPVDGGWFAVIDRNLTPLCSHGVRDHSRNADLPCLKYGNVTAMKDGRPVRICAEHVDHYV